MRHCCGGCRRVRRARAGFEIDHSEPQARVWRSRGRPGPTAPATPASPQANTRQPHRSEGPGRVLVGGVRAWPGFETTRRATRQRPASASVEGAGGSGGHGRASRSTTPSRRLACGDLAGGRARRRPQHQRHHKQTRGSPTGAKDQAGCWWAASGPGRALRRRAQPPISHHAPLLWRAPEGPEGTGGLRDRPLRAKLACGDLAGGRTRRRPQHQRHHKQPRNANARQPVRAAARSRN